ncbi:MAG: hypothetical protein N3D10_02990 [Candidatus Micrarchaeota archaeon]|nr:hypothetical protein [Candidatus Micrarchaeota archaeon]
MLFQVVSKIGGQSKKNQEEGTTQDLTSSSSYFIFSSAFKNIQDLKKHLEQYTQNLQDQLKKEGKEKIKVKLTQNNNSFVLEVGAAKVKLDFIEREGKRQIGVTLFYPDEENRGDLKYIDLAKILKMEDFKPVKKKK